MSSKGQLITEYALASQGLGIADLSTRIKIKVEGQDRLDYLHRILTQDMKTLTSGQGCFAAFLSAQGKILWIGFVFIFENFILLDMDPGAHHAIQELRKLIVMDDVVLTDVTDCYQHYFIAGESTRLRLNIPACSPTLSKVRSTSIKLSGVESYLISHSLPLFPQTSLLVAKEMSAGATAYFKSSGIPLLSPETTEHLRIERGTPSYGLDFNTQNILSETGFDALCVSHTKGCYPGQEVVARIDTYGGLKRKLVPIKFAGSSPPIPNDPVLNSSEVSLGTIGFITSAAKHPDRSEGWAIASIQHNEIVVGKSVCIRNQAGNISGVLENSFYAAL